jgi:phage FluMu protein gp41
MTERERCLEQDLQAEHDTVIRLDRQIQAINRIVMAAEDAALTSGPPPYGVALLIRSLRSVLDGPS